MKKLTKTVFFSPTSVKIHILGNKVKNCPVLHRKRDHERGKELGRGMYTHRSLPQQLNIIVRHKKNIINNMGRGEGVSQAVVLFI